MPTPITLTKPLFDALRAAIAERELLMIRLREALRAADQALREAQIEAGLDPALSYTVDRATLTATPQAETSATING